MCHKIMSRNLVVKGLQYNGGEDETRVGSETGELRSKKGQKSAQQPPPAIAVTPQNKIRAPYNNNNAKPIAKRLMG